MKGNNPLRRRDLLLLIPGALLLPRVTLVAAEGDWPSFRGPGASGVQDGFTLPEGAESRRFGRW